MLFRSTSPTNAAGLAKSLRQRILRLGDDWSEPFSDILFDEIGFLTSRIKNLGLFLGDVAYWKTHMGEAAFYEKHDEFNRDLEKIKGGLRDAMETRDKYSFIEEVSGLINTLLVRKGLDLLGTIN